MESTETAGMTLNRILQGLVILAFLPLAGCSTENRPESEGSSTSACVVDVPHLRAGDHAVYDAEGWYATPSQWSIIPDWRLAGSTQGQAPGPLPVGSSLSIDAALEPEARLTASGAFEPSWKISTTVKRPEDPKAVVVLDDWIAEEGGLVQSVDRNTYLREDGRVLSYVHFQKQDFPTALFSPVFWGRELRGPEQMVLELASERNFPTWPAGTVTTFLNVTEVVPVDGACQATILATYKAPGSPRTLHEVEFTLRNGTALPVVYEHRAWDQNVDPPVLFGEPFRLRLSSFDPGMGLELPSWGLHVEESGGLAVATPTHGFLHATEGIFPTPWPEVVLALEANSEYATWMAGHPGAAISRVVHVLGDDQASVIDEWLVEVWPGSGGEGLIAWVTRTSPLLPFLDEEISVRLDYKSVAAPASSAQQISLLALTQVFTQMAGKDPEVLACDLMLALCGIGTHNGTGRPWAGSTAGASLILLELQVDYRTGIVHTYAGADPDIL